ncbi:MAG: hypothetical protein HY816_23230 [Candidatus Wallbacteria bacterium]|nr:hypothetical protein [Candidatus Wallbacteria bacterium]
MTRSSCRALLLAGLLAATSLDAAGTRQRTIRTADDFGQGESEAVAIRESGVLVPGRSRETVSGFGRAVWSLLPLDPESLLVATLEPSGLHRLKDGKTEPLHTDPGALGYTLAAEPSGVLYAGELSQGRVLRITASREVTPHATFPAGSIWGMACDADGTLYCATGPRGTLFRVATDGKAEPWFVASEHNLLAVAVTESGKVLAGGGDRGNVYSVLGKNRGEVLYHFSAESEVRSIVPAGDRIYVAVNQTAGPDSSGRVHRHGSDDATGADATSPVQDSPDESPPDDESTASGRASGKAEQQPGALGGFEVADAEAPMSGTLYVLDDSRKAEVIASFPDEMLLCLAREDDGQLLVGTGPQGRLYRVDPASGEKVILHQMQQGKVTALALRLGRLAAAGTADGGTVVLSGPPSPNGTWTSPVYDAATASRFGALRIHGSGNVRVQTRSGDDPRPELHWGEWSRPLLPPGGAIASAPGRFLQLRVELGAADALVDELTFFHAGPNHRPRIESLEIAAASAPDVGGSADKSAAANQPVMELPTPSELAPSRPAKGKKRSKNDSDGASTLDVQPAPGSLKITWTATDADEDDLLAFRLHYRDRALGARSPWLPLGADFPLEDAREFVWDTTLVPDGRYELRLQATDERSNPPTSTLTAERLSELIVVDNSRPVIVELTVASGAVTGVAQDRGTHVAALSYSIDGGPFTPIDCADGLFDGPEERFSFRLPAATAGPHVLTVEALDAQGNAGLAHALFESPK